MEKYIKFDKKNIFFALLLLLPERMIFLVNQNRFQQMFGFTYSDFVVIVYFILFIYVFLHFKTRVFNKYHFAKSLFMIIPLIIIAAIMSNIFFGQNIRHSIWGQRFFFMMICSYYIFRTFIVENVISTDYLWNFLYKLSFIITAAVIIQHSVIGTSFQLLKVAYNSRFGVRITDNITYATILLVGALSQYFTTKCRKDKIMAALGLIMAYYHVVFVSQTRIVMVAYGILTIFMALFSRNNVSKKIIYLFIFIGLVLILMQTELGQYLMSSVSDTSSDPSAKIREVGREYYVQEIGKYPIFGRGYPLTYDALAASGLNSSIALNDNGLYGFTYMYGFLGLVWYLFLSIKMFLCAFKAAREGEYRYILFFGFLQAVCINIIWWFWKFSFGAVLTIILAMMEEYNKKNTEPKIGIFI